MSGVIGGSSSRSNHAAAVLMVTEALLGAGLVLFGWVDQDASWGRVGALALLLSPAGIWAGDAPPKQPPALEFKGYLTPIQRIQLASKVRGQVAEVFVKEGQRVKKGEILVRLA